MSVDVLRSFYKESNVLPFSTVSSALRLGTKFQVDSMRKEALSRLSACFPKTLDDFHSGVSLFRTHQPDHPRSSPIELREKDAPAVFHLACDLGLDELIPAAIYTCAQLQIHDLFAAHRAGSLTFLELQACMEERDELQSDCVRMAVRLTESGASLRCRLAAQKGTACIDAMRQIADGFIRLHADFRDFNEPSALECLLDNIEDTKSMCKNCRTVAIERLEGARYEVWGRLWEKYVSVRFSLASAQLIERLRGALSTFGHCFRSVPLWTIIKRHNRDICQ